MDKEDSDLRDVPGYEGRYAVTSNGRVWSYRLARWLKPFLSSRGYQQVNFRREVGRNVMPLVHRLVALAWIPNPAGLLEVNHLNGRKSHNFVDAPFWWKRIYGNWRQVNVDGTPHLCTAPTRSRPFATHASPEIVGERYTPNCGDCSTPPWESCACSERLAA